MKALLQPSTRGNIQAAISSSSLSKVSPESPRPLEMLDAVEITSADILTADDAALHELLVSAAYEADKNMSAEFTSISVSVALKFLGEHARRDALKASMSRLMSTTVSYGTKKTRRFEHVPLLFSYLETNETEDVIKYALPEPIRVLMREMPAYAYLELAALSQMKSKYSVRLYRIFAAATAREKWTPSGDNRVVVSATLEDLYTWTGFPLENGSPNFGKFRQRVLNVLQSELSTVRRFSLRIDEIRKEARGRPLERVDFVLNLRAPSHHMKHASFEKGEHKQKNIGGVDAPQYRVNSMIWQKAQSSFWSHQRRLHSAYFDAWQLALLEAIDEAPVSPGYGRREYRGRRLLNAIRDLGADEAAYKFCAEEVAEPDLLVDGDPISVSVDPTDAIEGRIYRYKKSDAPAPVAAEAVKKDDNAQKTVVTLPFKRGFDRPPLAKTTPAVAAVDNAIEVAATDLDVSDLDAQLLENLISDTPVEPQPTFSLSGIREVMFTADRERSLEEIQDELFDIIQDWDFEGDQDIGIAVRVFTDTAQEFEFGVHKTCAEDIQKLHNVLLTRGLLDAEFNELELIK